MARDPNIPLFLWVATAVLVHLLSGGGVDRVSQVISDRTDVQRFAESVRRHVRLSATPLEVSLFDPDEDSPAYGAASGPDNPDDVEEPEDALEPEETDPEASREEVLDPDSERDEKLEEPEVAEREKQKDEKTKPEKKDEPEPEKEKPKDAEDFPQLRLQNRIAVEQHVDENQKDNPNAEFIGDHANRVAEQTQARITATDQNDRTPNPGSTYQGPASQPGNAHETDIAHSEDAPGELDRAPSESASGGDNQDAVASMSQPRGGTQQSARDVRLEGSEKGRSDGVSGQASSPDARSRAQSARPSSLAARGAEASPETLDSAHGSFSMRRPQEARQARREQKGRKKRLPPRKGSSSPMDFLGLGGSGRTRGGVNLNLTHSQALAAVGNDQLGREKKADGERRRSKHRGSWRSLGIEKWRASIENYNSSVKPGNQTALNTARVPFASYLNRIHNRLHPIFADSFLGSLSSLPREHPLNRTDMKANLEIVLDKNQGRVVKMGVTRSSGSTVFDIAALESVQSAQPFGKPPNMIVSQDGNVYLHWEFHRNPYYACSTYFARPYKLKGKPKSAPPNIKSPTVPRFGPQEQPIPRKGHLHIPSVDSPHTHAAR